MTSKSETKPAWWDRWKAIIMIASVAAGFGLWCGRLETGLHHVESSHEEVSGSVHSIRDDVLPDMNSKLSSVATGHEGLTDTVSQAQADIREVRADIQQTQADVGGMSSKLSSVSTDLDTLRESVRPVSDLSSRLASLETGEAALKEFVPLIVDMRSEIASLKTRQEEMGKQLDRLDDVQRKSIADLQLSRRVMAAVVTTKPSLTSRGEEVAIYVIDARKFQLSTHRRTKEDVERENLPYQLARKMAEEEDLLTLDKLREWSLKLGKPAELPSHIDASRSYAVRRFAPDYMEKHPVFYLLGLGPSRFDSGHSLMRHLRENGENYKPPTDVKGEKKE